MPDDPKPPEVHARESPGGTRTIAGLPTALALFVGRSARGPIGRPVRCGSHADFVHVFSDDSTVGDLPHHVRLFFLNGGTDCLVVRIEGEDGSPPLAADYDAAYEIVDREVDVFNLLILPPSAGSPIKPQSLSGGASAFCQRRRALLVMDPPDSWTDAQAIVDADTGIGSLRVGMVRDVVAIYFPNVVIDHGGRQVAVGPAGAVAGVMARIDATRGVWKAPAGLEADLRGIVGLDRRLTEAENRIINPRAVNALRVVPSGIVVWGARTMDGDDALGSEYKYVPVRRLALFLEESLRRGLTWAVREPNDEPLWARIRLAAGSFLHDLFRRGAFRGTTPRDAYFVKCDRETTTQRDRTQGVVRIQVGFAPLKPAEFIVLTLLQRAGSIEP